MILLAFWLGSNAKTWGELCSPARTRASGPTWAAQFLAFRIRRLLEQQARGEGCYGSQEPLHAVELYGLKIVESLNAVDHAHGDPRHDQTRHSDQESDQGGGGQSKRALDVVELQVERPMCWVEGRVSREAPQTWQKSEPTMNSVAQPSQTSTTPGRGASPETTGGRQNSCCASCTTLGITILAFLRSQAGDQKPKIAKSLKRRFFCDRARRRPSPIAQELPLALGKMRSIDYEKLILER